MSELPIFYSFRRCPYAMRARMALLISKQSVRLREVILRDKPQEMLDSSPKATVPVLVMQDEGILEESLDVMLWALAKNDPDSWLTDKAEAIALVKRAEEEFKFHLDRYKYPSRYENVDALFHRGEGLKCLQELDGRIAKNGQLSGNRATLADFAIFPFIRQFANHDRDWFDAQDIPALQYWLAGHLASEIFATTMTKYPQWQTGDEEPVFAA